MYKKISDYGIIGNLYSIALIGLDGSVDWMCLPHIDSPSVFGALLDDTKGGRFAVAPAEECDSVAEYAPDTNVLVTRFRTRGGVMELVDFMPIALRDGEESGEERHELYRLAKVTKGKLDIRLTFEPRFDYARARTSLRKVRGGIVAEAGEESLALASDRDIDVKDDMATARWTLSEGEEAWLHLIYGSRGPLELDPSAARKDLDETTGYWRDWLRKSETGRTLDFGPYSGMANRSALVLKLLYYNPTGAIAAAATTSLPERVGGVRNWDYRYTWIRDTSFTLQALFKLGHLSETEGYLRWIETLLSEYGAERFQIMYGLRGEEDLTETELTHLDGYKGSRPVRIGNDAAKQKQLDIYGEIMDAAMMLSDYVGKIDFTLWPFLRGVCDHVCEHWREKDQGIWEVKCGPYHFVYSKVMCWVALDRGITIARRYGFPADLLRWERTREAIKREVLEKGWSEEKKSFVQHYETDALDSSALLIPAMGFLPPDDPRVVSTVEALQRELGHDGLLYRYDAEDGLPGGEGVFLLCTFWLIHYLASTGRREDAEQCLARMQSVSNHLGLFSEEYDVDWREALGNFPQAFTHIGYINSVIALSEQEEKETEKARELKGLTLIERWLGPKRVLNDGEPKKEAPPNEIAYRLKTYMNLLRGAFFNTAQGRVAYERMRDSRLYEEYEEISYELKKMRPEDLRSREEQIAFWINLYNVLVIHGVIELGIRDSVKEVRNFFKRIQYRIGDMLFTPDDIEHGVLRGNTRPPHSLLRLFGKDDPRRKLVIEPTDPRIHFALVCASSSCPPIDVYTPENLDDELTISGRTFLNAGGIRLDKASGRASLSLIFKWYYEDFGESDAEIVGFIAPFMYREEDRRYLEENAERLKIDYQGYDWRLNRY